MSVNTTAEAGRPADDEATADVDLLDPITDHYAMIPNDVLRDHSISTDARAILCEWLSHSKSWKFDLQQTAAENGLHRERARRAVKELRIAGYVHLIKISRGRGDFTTRYRVSNRAGVKCRTRGCQDCGTGGAEQAREPASDEVIGTRKSVSRTDQAKQGVSPGGIGTRIYESRKTVSQVLEDHVSEDHKNLSLAEAVATRLAAAGLPDGEREIRSLADYITERATADPARSKCYLAKMSPADLARVLHSPATGGQAAPTGAAGRHPSARPVSAALHGGACDHGYPDAAANCPFCRAGVKPADEAPARRPSRGAVPPADLLAETRQKLAELAGHR